ncbi:MAG: flagellar FliJ protein [Oleispira sp.]|jgi:flagellar FliJ protein
MSKQRIKRLGFVLKMASDKEQQDLKVWGQYQQKLEKETATLTQLEQYMTEYRLSLTSHATTAIQGGQIQNTIAFIEQIKEASGHQQQQIDLVQQQAEGAKRLYLAARAKAEALRKLIEKLKQQTATLEEKQDQKMMDEFAARSARNRQL